MIRDAKTSIDQSEGSLQVFQLPGGDFRFRSTLSPAAPDTQVTDARGVRSL